MQPFPLFQLLEQFPGVFSDQLLPALEPRHRAALALTCSTMRRAVHGAATTLTLRAGDCCMSREHPDLGCTLPHVSQLVIKPGNLHEAMFVVPLLFMQAARHMTGLTSLHLHDLLPNMPPDEAKCGSCAALASTYDLSAMLATAAHCAPALAELQFYTHYISDGECAAVSLMTGLTRLHLRSTHGTHVGGLSRLRALSRLASLTLSDRGWSSRSSPSDLVMLLGASTLTHLALGPHSLAGPLVNCLAEMHAPDWQAGLVRVPAPAQQQQQRAAGAQPAAGAAAEGAAAGQIRSDLAVRALADQPAVFDPASQRELPAPPPLLSLSLVLLPGPRFERAFSSTACLTRLTSLALGWVPSGRALGAGQLLDLSPDWPVAVQQQLTNLVRLRRLAVGWTLKPQVLEALGASSTLTHLQLGGLFSALPAPHPVGQLRLPFIRSLTAQLETPLALLRAAADPADPEPLAHGSCVAALAAFPALSRLELAGQLYGPALALLPQLLSREQLRELLLPQRLSATGAELAQLRQLRGLTRLRVGWRSLQHAGPAGYVPVGGEQPTVPLSLEALVTHKPASEHHNTTSDSRPAAAAAAAAAASPGDGAAVTGVDAAAAVQAATADPVVPAATTLSSSSSSPCDVCGALPSSGGCLCRLRCLEVTGPLPPSELWHLHALPALRHLILRDNASWSTGLPVTALAALTSQLTLLELYHCEGVSGASLEQPLSPEAASAAVLAAAKAGVLPPGCSSSTTVEDAAARAAREAGQRNIASWAYSGARVVTAPRSGITAAELGRGYSAMGVLLNAADEFGLMLDELPGALNGAQQQQQQQPGGHAPLFMMQPPPGLAQHLQGIPGALQLLGGGLPGLQFNLGGGQLQIFGAGGAPLWQGQLGAQQQQQQQQPVDVINLADDDEEEEEEPVDLAADVVVDVADEGGGGGDEQAEAEAED